MSRKLVIIERITIFFWGWEDPFKDRLKTTTKAQADTWTTFHKRVKSLFVSLYFEVSKEYVEIFEYFQKLNYSRLPCKVLMP